LEALFVNNFEKLSAWLNSIAEKDLFFGKFELNLLCGLQDFNVEDVFGFGF